MFRGGDGWRVEHCDSVMWSGGGGDIADLHVYLEMPVRLAMPWARQNCLVVNPEWFPAVAWNWCLAAPEAGGMDLVVVKCRAAAALFPELRGTGRLMVVPWRSDMDVATLDARERRFLYVIGGSPCKTLAARVVVACWRASWPPLEIWCSPEIAGMLRPLVRDGHVEFQTAYRSAAEREARQRACAWHVVASAAEGFGMTAAEAAVCGAPMLWCDLPVLRESWWPEGGPGCIAVSVVADSTALHDVSGAVGDYKQTMREPHRLPVDEQAVVRAVEELLALEDDKARLEGIQRSLRERRSAGLRAFRAGWGRILERCVVSGARVGGGGGGLPRPAPRGTAPPHVAVVTLTRGRRHWWPVMLENLRRVRWPLARLEWIVVGEPDERPLPVEEAPCAARWITTGVAGDSVGAKRNAGVRAASAGASVFVMMDDDDHYPAESVGTRVGWLMGGGSERGAAYCAAIAMYDLRRYVSAINVPPLILGPAERVSEATLAFTRRFWEERPFPDVSVAEGCGFVEGREAATVEIPPAGVIVSFLHRGNSTSRRVPADQEPNGCHWGFSDDYFRLVHTVAEAGATA